MTEKNKKKTCEILIKTAAGIFLLHRGMKDSQQTRLSSAGRCIIIKQLITLSSTQPASGVYRDSITDTLISITSKEIDPVSDLS